MKYIMILMLTVGYGQDYWLTDYYGQKEMCGEPLLENPFNILYNQNETIIVIRDSYFGNYYKPLQTTMGCKNPYLKSWIYEKPIIHIIIE